MLISKAQMDGIYKTIENLGVRINRMAGEIDDMDVELSKSIQLINSRHDEISKALRESHLELARSIQQPLDAIQQLRHDLDDDVSHLAELVAHVNRRTATVEEMFSSVDKRFAAIDAYHGQVEASCSTFRDRIKWLFTGKV